MSNLRFYQYINLLKFDRPGELKQMVEAITCENDLQVCVMHYLQSRNVAAYAIPNGSYKSGASAALFKFTGLKSGVPDIHIPVAASGCHSMYIELKFGKNKLQPSQIKWIEILTHLKNYVVVHRHLIEAIRDIDQYLNLKPIIS